METASSFPLPQPDELTVREKEDAMGAWLMAFGALHLGLPLPFAGLAASGIYHAVNAKKSQFTRFHCFQSLLLSVPVSVLSAVWVVWAVVLFVRWLDPNAFPAVHPASFWWYSLVCLVVYLFYLVVCVVGAWKARQGRLWYFPLAGRWAFSHAFGPRRTAPPPPERNLPPQ